MEKPAALAKIWRETHKDFKGKLADGTKTIMVYRTGTCLVALDNLTDDEIISRIKPFALD